MATHASASKSGRGKGPERDKKTISRNRTARHDYEIGETWEAGIELTGTEVKSIRERPCQITDSFCIVVASCSWWGSTSTPTPTAGCGTSTPTAAAGC